MDGKQTYTKLEFANKVLVMVRLVNIGMIYNKATNK